MKTCNVAIKQHSKERQAERLIEMKRKKDNLYWINLKECIQYARDE